MTNDVPPRDPHPTLHALRVFGGALGMALIVTGLLVVAAQWDGAFGGCGRCRAIGLGAIIALVLGVLLVRGAWRAMQIRPPGGAIR